MAIGLSLARTWKETNFREQWSPIRTMNRFHTVKLKQNVNFLLTPTVRVLTSSFLFSVNIATYAIFIIGLATS